MKKKNQQTNKCYDGFNDFNFKSNKIVVHCTNFFIYLFKIYFILKLICCYFSNQAFGISTKNYMGFTFNFDF